MQKIMMVALATLIIFAAPVSAQEETVTFTYEKGFYPTHVYDYSPECQAEYTPFDVFKEKMSNINGTPNTDEYWNNRPVGDQIQLPACARRYLVGLPYGQAYTDLLDREIEKIERENERAREMEATAPNADTSFASVAAQNLRNTYDNSVHDLNAILVQDREELQGLVRELEEEREELREVNASLSAQNDSLKAAVALQPKNTGRSEASATPWWVWVLTVILLGILAFREWRNEEVRKKNKKLTEKLEVLLAPPDSDPEGGNSDIVPSSNPTPEPDIDNEPDPRPTDREIAPSSPEARTDLSPPDDKPDMGALADPPSTEPYVEDFEPRARRSLEPNFDKLNLSEEPSTPLEVEKLEF